MKGLQILKNRSNGLWNLFDSGHKRNGHPLWYLTFAFHGIDNWEYTIFRSENYESITHWEKQHNVHIFYVGNYIYFDKYDYITNKLADRQRGVITNINDKGEATIEFDNSTYNIFNPISITLLKPL
jgi:hypothetical protein